MASGRACTFVFLVLIFSQVISSAAADFDDSDGQVDPNSGDDYISTSSCSGISPSDLGDGCSISDDCSTITCKMDFVSKPITFKLEVNKCEDPVSVTASMEVPDLDITWSHTYTSDEVIRVPGFSVSLPPLISAGVYVQVGITDNGDNLHLKVNLLVGESILSDENDPKKVVTVVEGDLPISTDDCGPFGWFIALSTPAKIAVIVGPILFIIIVATCCCCCCGCCGCCRSRPSQHGTVVMATGASGVGTSIQSNVKMRPLVEEI